MALCSSPFSLPILRPLQQSPTSKSSLFKLLIATKYVPMMSTSSSSSSSSSISELSSISHPSLQRLRCCTSSSSLTEHEESPSTRIFIKGGLSQSTSEGNLKKAFSQFGEVNRVKILTDKRSRKSLGFAYLWFTSEDCANLALKEMNGKFFEGRFVSVTTAKPGPSKSRVKATPYKF